MRAEKRIISCSLSNINVKSATYADLEIAPRSQFMTIGMSTRTEVCQIRRRISQIYVVERNSSKMILPIRGEIDENYMIWT